MTSSWSISPLSSYDFTAGQEEQFDRIAVGRADWRETVDKFYKTFEPLLSSIPSGHIAGRLVGTDPATGQPVYAKISKMGPCVQLGEVKNGKPRFASLKKGQSVFSITLNEALELFKTALPITLGEIDGKEVIVGEGKFGPYVRHNKSFVSIPKGTDPLTLTLEDAMALIQQKQEADKPIHQWGDIAVLKGRYGAYIRTPQGNYQIAKTVDPESLTEEQVREIMAKNEPLRPAKTGFRRKSAK